MATVGNLITTDVAAKILDVTETRVRQLRIQGRIKAVQQVGQAHLFDRDEIVAFGKLDRPTGRPSQQQEKPAQSRRKKHGR